MRYELRERQVEASNAGYGSLMNGNKKDLIYATCGFGKSLVIADIAHRLAAPTLVLQPSVEILKQNYEKMISYGVEGVTLYSASVKQKNHGEITFATIQSIYKNPEEFKRYHYIICDEAHRISPSTFNSMYGKFFQSIGDPPRLFLTGSPYRTTHKFVTEKEMINGIIENAKYYTTTLSPLNRIYNKDSKDRKNMFLFGNIIFKAEMMEQIEAGFLCQPEYDLNYSKAYDYSNLQMNSTGADFDQEALDRFVNEKSRLQQIVQACADYDRKVNHNLIFCSSIKQAETCMEYVASLGLTTDIITGKHTEKQKNKILDKFRSGITKHLFNVKVLDTGFDMPQLDCVTFAKPTLSVDNWMQAVARCIRKDPNNPYKKAYVIDIAGVSKRLGRIETIRLDKEDKYKDIVVSEVGVLTGKMLSKFRMLPQKIEL